MGRNWGSVFIFHNKLNNSLNYLTIDGTDMNEDSEENVKFSSNPKISQSKPSKGKDKELDYLPDHLFSEALLLSSTKSQTSKRATSKEDERDSSHQSSSKRRKRAAQSQKDIVLGYVILSCVSFNHYMVLNSRSKAIRILTERKADPVLKTASRTIPPGKVRRFADKRLHLKVDKRNSNWQRKPGKNTVHNDINCNLILF